MIEPSKNSEELQSTQRLRLKRLGQSRTDSVALIVNAGAANDMKSDVLRTADPKVSLRSRSERFAVQQTDSQSRDVGDQHQVPSWRIFFAGTLLVTLKQSAAQLVEPGKLTLIGIARSGDLVRR